MLQQQQQFEHSLSDGSFMTTFHDENEEDPQPVLNKNYADVQAKRIQRQLGQQLKFKQPAFVVYMRKHPIYAIGSGEQQKLQAQLMEEWKERVVKRKESLMLKSVLEK